MRGPSRTISLFLLIATVAGAVILIYALVHPPPTVSEELTELTELQEKAVDIMLEMNKMAISIALLIFTGFGILLTSDRPLFSFDNGLQRILATLSLAAATVSLFAGYVLYDKLIEMLSNSFLDLGGPLLLYPRELQIDSLLLSVVLLAATLLAGRRQ